VFVWRSFYKMRIEVVESASRVRAVA